jgi:hypothetical protein
MPSTDEDILRAAMRRCTEEVHAPASIAAQVVSRQRRRERRGRILTLTATTAALGTAAGVVALVPRQAAPNPGAHPARPAITLTAAQRTLYRLSSLAAAASPGQGQGRYVVMREIQDNYQRTSVIDSRTGDVWTFQKGAGVPAELPVARHDSPTQAQFAAMPTDPAALRALLISQYDQQQKQADAAMAAQLKQKDKILRGQHRPAIKPLRLTADDKVFEQAGLLLWNPLVPPALRSAVFRVLAATPGVRVNSHARDDRGRPAVEISWFDRVTSDTLSTFEDPATARMLEQTDTAAPAGVNGHSTYTGRDLYLSITRASSVPANPYR